MTQNTVKTLAAVALLMAATVPAWAYTGWQVGTWTHTATVDDREVRVKLEVKADTIHCSIRTSEGPAVTTITVDADYLISRDGTVIGILAPAKTKDKTDEKEALKERVFTCRVSPEKNYLVVTDVSCGGDKDQIKKVIEGKYRKVEAKSSHVPTPSYTPPAPPPPPQAPPISGGIGELISTELEPGVDPIKEATKRGNILLIVRLGNIDLEKRPFSDSPALPRGVGQ